MRSEQKRFYDGLVKLLGAFVEVSGAWNDLNGAEDESACEEYPFKEDFDTIMLQVGDWTTRQLRKKARSENEEE